MQRDLRQPIIAARLPDDVVRKPFGAELATGCRALMNRVYADGYGDVVPLDLWWPKLRADSEYDPALVFVAAAAGETVGFCQCWTAPFVKDIVVDRTWRGRGVGTALLTMALTAYKARGAASVDLKTDVDNTTAQSLYRRLGFVIVERAG